MPQRKEATFEDVLSLQKQVLSFHPQSEDEKIRLALLYAASGSLEESERLLSLVRVRANRMVPYVELFLRRQLGDHKEAGRLLAQFADEERLISGFSIERAELVTRVRRFRDYTPAQTDRVAPGGDVHLYIEPKGYALRQTGDRCTFHLRYDWKLIDERSVEQLVSAWEKASTEEREDQVTSMGPVTEFYQSFHLPLPLNLASGAYRVKVVVTDVISGKSEQVYIPIHVTSVEGTR